LTVAIGSWPTPPLLARADEVIEWDARGIDAVHRGIDPEQP
jgi:hypothetical protein